MKTIYKYKIDPYKPYLSAPITKMLSVQCQRDNITLWAEVDTEQKDRHFMFVVIGTGWDLSDLAHFDKMTYLSTVQQFDGDLIWHIYYLELNVPYDKIGQE